MLALDENKHILKVDRYGMSLEGQINKNDDDFLSYTK